MPRIEELQQTPGRHARRARSIRVSSSLSEINVVPLIDVMLVLLIIFMVTAPMMQQGFGVHLPQARRAASVTAPLTITVPLSYRQDRKLRLGNELIGIDVLAERVRQDLSNRLSKDVLLASDAGVTMGEAIGVMDKLREAGVDKVGLQTQPPTGGRQP